MLDLFKRREKQVEVVAIKTLHLWALMLRQVTGALLQVANVAVVVEAVVVA
jgi:hypothetical protein